MRRRPLAAPGISACTLALAAACGLLVSACEDRNPLRSHRLDNRSAAGLSDPELRHPVRFRRHTESLDVEVPPGVEGLSANQHIDVYRFLDRYKHEAVGRLVVSVPQRRARQGRDRPLGAGHSGARGGGGDRLSHAARAAGASAQRNAGRSARLPASGRRAARLRPLAGEPCAQRGAHPLYELGLCHAAQRRRHGRQRARSAPAAGGRSPLGRAAQHDMVGLRRRRAQSNGDAGGGK